MRIPLEQRVSYAAADEFECLNLIVTAPVGSFESLLPVMVYIHGGANVRGSGSAKVLDPSNLVRRSLLMNKPVIIVTLNYRVNYFGFAWVKSGNNGLHDMLNGFLWVQKHIAGFGGDPDQITAFGQSAGGGAVDAFLQVRQGRPFRRAIMQSGTTRAAPPKNRAEHDEIIAHLCQFCNVDQTQKDWQTSLQSVPADKVIAAVATANFEVMPYADDGDFFNTPWQQTCAKWVDSVMIGDCGFESVVHLQWVRLWTTASLIQDFSSSKKYGAAIMAAYNLNKDSTDAEAKQIGLDFLSDAVFTHAAHALARKYKAASIPVYQYIFDQVNPFDPSAKAHHSVDLLYLFKAFDFSKTAEANTEEFSKSVQEKWLTYATGGSPWAKDTYYAFGPSGQIGPLSTEDLAKRRRLGVYDLLSQIPIYDLNDVVEHVMRLIVKAN